MTKKPTYLTRKQIFLWLHRIFSWFLVVNAVLVGACFLLFTMASNIGTRLNGEWSALAEQTFLKDWYIQKHIPAHLPLQQILVIDADGDILQGYPARFSGSIDEFVRNYATTHSPDLAKQVTSALGGWLEPLRDRYRYIGRTPTFLLQTYEQENGWLVAIALWRSLPARLAWASYAGLIYAYLIFWILAPIWVYLDAKKHTSYAWRWAIFTAFANIVGVGAYLFYKQRATA